MSKDNQWMNRVIICIGLSIVWIFFTIIAPCAITFLIKYIMISTYSVLSWNIWFLIKCMTLWLLYTIVNSYCKPKSPTKPLSQIASFTISIVIMYFASIVDKVNIDFNVTFQLLTPPHNVNTYSVRAFLLSKSST